MATVFDNSMTAHAWAHGNGEARSHNGNLYARGAVLFSYGAHFPVGIRFPYDAPGGAAFILNADSYSISTTRHQHEALRATHGPTRRVPGLAAIWRSLEAFADGRGDSAAAKRVREHLEKPICADMTEEGVRLVLELVKSRADPARVLAKANKAREAEKEKRDKKERARMVEKARRAVALPLSSFDGSGSEPVASTPTELNRAWKAAKASGWSEKRLRDLRQREKALRANMERVERRRRRVRTNDAKRAQIHVLRRLTGSLPVAEAFARGSVGARAQIAGALGRFCILYPYNKPAALGIPAARWNQSADATREAADACQRVKARAMQRHAEYEAANAPELWRAGELPTHRLPYPYRRMDNALVRAVHVTRDESGAITGGELQTSGGARVPLVRAILLFRFLKLIRERFEKERPGADGRVEVAWRRNGERARVGAFEVDMIYGDGSLKAGCHFIQWRESRDLAESLGVFDAAPSAELLKAHESA